MGAGGGERVRLLSLARDLRRRRARERQGLFVAEGVRAVEELLASGVPVRGALAGPSLAGTPRGEALRAAIAERGVPLLDVSDPEFASAADTESPQGILAVGEQPRAAVGDVVARLADGSCALLLDAVQDPGNAGTMLRSAAAFGAAGVVAVTGTVDLWGAKVVRSAMGALFRQPVAQASWAEVDAALHGTELWAADGAGVPVSRLQGERPGRLVLAVGNEGAGLSDEARRRASRLVAVPIASGVESLNAAVAAGILLYELRPAALRA